MMQQHSFAPEVLGSVLYILSGLLLQSVSLVKQAVSRKDRLLFHFRTEGLRDMLKRQFSYFLLECMRESQRSREHSGGSVREGGGEGFFVQPDQDFQKQVQPTATCPSQA